VNHSINNLKFHLRTFENVGPEKSGDENVRVLVWNPKGDDFVSDLRIN
jgi:hypothetical protein